MSIFKEKILIAIIAIVVTVLTSIPIYSYAAGNRDAKLLETIGRVEKNANKIDNYITTNNQLKSRIITDLEVIKNDLIWLKSEIKKDKLASK